MNKEMRKEENGGVNLTEARKYLLELVPQAGEMLRKYFVSGGFTVRQKEGVDLTTQADVEVDGFLREGISKRYPHTSFLTEETAPSDYSSLIDAENLWVIDPLDGTINFSRKNSHFAISVALVNRAKSRLGVVYNPMAKDMYWAQQDIDNAFINDEAIYVSQIKDLREVVIAFDWAYDLEKRKDVVRWLKNISQHVRQMKSMGSAVSDLASLASGRVDAYIHSGLKPWDVAAPALLIEKAGGRISTPRGENWDVFNPAILATNGILHDQILELMGEEKNVR